MRTCQKIFGKEISSEENQYWAKFLAEYSLAELRYAFDNWTRNGRFFPRPKDILDLVEAYRLTQTQKALGYPGCDAECKSHHGKGYNGQDMVWLFDRLIKEQKLLGRKLTKREKFALLDELDERRGEIPEWRRNPA